MLKPRFVLGALVSFGLLAYLITALRPQGEVLETITLTHSVAERPAMCPWRDPVGDMRAFFPDAGSYHTDILTLSRIRLEILKRLGPGSRLDSNSLYVYRV